MSSLPSMLDELPAIRGAKLPSSYAAARTALADCVRIDECKKWANKAQALASYARQADDTALERFAIRIRARAIKRCGELLQEIKPDSGGRPSKTRTANGTSFGRTAAATAAGLSKRQKDTA